jgi:hypothetical protein
MTAFVSYLRKTVDTVHHLLWTAGKRCGRSDVCCIPMTCGARVILRLIEMKFSGTWCVEKASLMHFMRRML